MEKSLKSQNMLPIIEGRKAFKGFRHSPKVNSLLNIITRWIRLFLSTGFIFYASTVGSAMAEESMDNGASEQAVQLITDQGTKTVTIVIDNEPMAQISKNGLLVVGDILYGGTIRDAGSGVVKEHMNAPVADLYVDGVEHE